MIGTNHFFESELFYAAGHGEYKNYINRLYVENLEVVPPRRREDLVLALFAMNRQCRIDSYEQSSDRIRASALLSMYSCRVVTISECKVEERAKNPDRRLAHVEADFKSLRGFKALFKDDLERQTMPHFIILDYFWLQRNYYKARYGTNWLSEKLALLLQQPSWIAMILPVDVGPDGHALRMLSNFESSTLRGNVKVERISAQENPLVKATLNANRKIALANKQSCVQIHEHQMRFLTTDEPFIVVSRNTRNWREELRLHEKRQ